MIAAHAELPSLCEHIHLPLQSGSSRILKAMRRTYDRDRYMQRVDDDPRARPGLRDHDRHHRRLPGRDRGRNSARRSRSWTRSATTPPSRSSSRRGAAREAAGLPDQVPHAVKRERMERLVELVQRRALERSSRFVGTTQEVLVEGPSRTDPARLRGRTRHNKTVNFSGLGAAGRPGRTSGSPSATSTTLAGEERSARARRLSAGADRASSGRPASARPRSRSRWPSCCARAASDPVAVSADAIQVYEGLDTLAAKPSAERARAARAPADLVRAGRRRSSASAEFAAARARGDRRAARRRARRPIVVGGTGLYLRAALTELDLKPPPAPGPARGDRARAAEVGPEALHGSLRPRARQAIHPNDRKRIVRALELERMGEEPLSRLGAALVARTCGARPACSGS